MNRFLRYLAKVFTLIALLLPLQSIAQLSVTPSNVPPFTPENLITNIFLGEGLEVIDIDFQGDGQQVGYFTDGTTDVGIDRGIIMSSGSVIDAAGPNNSGSNSGSFPGNNTTDVDLSAIANANVLDVAKYEITFVPISDTLRFRFVFASEEYPEYACSSFNDAFGFFISGPGINGGFSNDAENIALVPDPADPTGLTFTDIPVTINNVNNAGINVPGGCDYDFGMYYNDNSGSLTMQYDGYLDVFTAQAVVIPCSTYTIKLAICDRGDTVWDSAVFLEAKSFGTGSLEVEASTVSLDGTLAEGCSPGTLTFSLPTPPESDFFIDYNIIGDAINGVDYDSIPLDLFIPAGDTSVSVPIIAIEDFIDEPLESIGIDVQRDPCNRDTFWIFIRDNLLEAPDLGNDTTICQGDTMSLDGTLSVEDSLPPPPTFVYDGPDLPISPTNAPVFADILVAGVQPAFLQDGVIKRVCLDTILHTWVDDLDIFLISPGGQFIELTTDNGANGNHYFNTCFTIDAMTPINFPGPFAPASATPFTGEWQPEGVWSDLWDGENPTNGTWRLQVVDDANGFTGTIQSWSICFEPVYDIIYEWTPSEGLSCDDCPDPQAFPDTTTTYVLTASDSYGCSVTDTVTINVIDAPDAPNLNCGAITDNTITVEWDSVPGAFSYEVSIDGGPWISASDSLSYTITGVPLSTCLEIEVRGVGTCGGEIALVDCCTPDCTPPTPAIDNTTDASCFNSTDGTVQVSATGTLPPYSYAIDGYGSNNVGFFDSLPPGTYTVNIQDGVFCPTSIEVTIGAPDSIVLTPVIINNVTCNGGSDATVTVEVEGGTSPYTFNWLGGSTDSVATGFSAGPVSVEVIDANGCSSLTVFSVTEDDALISFSVPDSVSCFGGSDGSVTTMTMGGIPPYDYQWDIAADSQTTSTAVDLPAGIYQVTIADANGCTVVLADTIYQFAPIDLITSAEMTSCFGSDDGLAIIEAQGGAGDFIYIWNDTQNQSTDTATNLVFGDYSVIVTDANGCVDSASVAVNAPDSLSFTVADSQQPSCFDSADGQLSLNLSGGTPGYEFFWDDFGVAPPDRIDLQRDTYQISATDANGCMDTLVFIMDAPEAISLEVDPADIQDVSCNGGNDGSAMATTTGGTAPYTYTWSDGTANGNMVQNLSADTSFVTVTDANGCEQIDTFVVEEPEGILLDFVLVDVSCEGDSSGSVDVTPIGGTAPYSYQWSNGDTTANSTNLFADDYTVVVTDANGCTVEETIAITESEALSVEARDLTNVSCFGGDDGGAVAIGTGGVEPYSITWNSGQTEDTINNFTAGTYVVTISDSLNCVATDTFEITEPAELLIDSSSTTAAACFEENSGAISVEIIGGTPPYAYLWNDNAIGNTPDATNLFAGDYSVTVTDANGCIVMQDFTVVQPDALVLSSDPVNVNCEGENTGSIDLTVEGGVGPYAYLWTNNAQSQDLQNLPADDYEVTVTDINGCEEILAVEITEPTAIELSFEVDNVDCFAGTDGSVTLDISGGVTPYSFSWTGPNGFTADTKDLLEIGAGNYNVTLTDANGCQETISTIQVIQPTEAVTTNVLPVDQICHNASNGTATVEVTGGTGPYTFLWNNNQTTATATDLSEGTYYVTVFDSENCTFIDSAEVIAYGEITATLTQTPPLCNDGNNGASTISTVFYDGDAAPFNEFSYEWNTNPGQEGLEASSLTGGTTYTVTITNDAGCSAVEQITIDNPPAIAASIVETTDVECFGGNEGTAEAFGEGGVGDYSYFWSPSAGSQTTQVAEQLSAGSHTVTITDENGCFAVAQTNIQEPAAILIEKFAKTDVLCYGGSTGAMSVTPEGGTPPYDYSWSGGQTTQAIGDIAAGTYDVTITDANGCTIIGSESIRQPSEPLTADLQGVQVSCFGNDDGQIIFEPQGGTPPYIYSIDGENYNGSSIQIGLEEGNYTRLYVQDANGCIYYAGSAYVGTPPPVEVDLGEDLSILFGDSVLLEPTISNTVGAVSYAWEPFDSIGCIDLECSSLWVSPTFDQYFTVFIEDERGCEAEDELFINLETNRGVYVPTGFTPNQDNNNDLLFVQGKSGTTILSFKVFDRWGELVFENGNFEVNEPSTGWNGEFRSNTAPPGVYVWFIEAVYKDGFRETLQGQTTLIR